jgi:hypothetical protein
MTHCWTIIAERNGRKWIIDNGFLSYEEADHFRLQWQQQRASEDQRYPRIDYFVARYDLDRSVFRIFSKKRCAKCGTQYEGIGCPRCYPRVTPAAGTGGSTGDVPGSAGRGASPTRRSEPGLVAATRSQLCADRCQS